MAVEEIGKAPPLPGNTTIQLRIETRELLKAQGKMGESYDDVIRRLIQENQLLKQ